jgi:hypothetical protein
MWSTASPVGYPLAPYTRGLYPLVYMKKQSQQLALMFGIGALVGVALANLFMSDTSRVDIESVPTAPTSTALIVESETESLSSSRAFPLPPTVPLNSRVGLRVDNQAASNAVMVATISASNPSWVAVYEDVSGTPGAILGAKKVMPWETFTVVPLLRPEGTMKGNTYYAVVLPDNGDGAFDHLSDTPPLSPDAVVMVKFLAE